MKFDILIPITKNMCEVNKIGTVEIQTETCSMFQPFQHDGLSSVNETMKCWMRNQIDSRGESVFFIKLQSISLIFLVSLNKFSGNSVMNEFCMVRLTRLEHPLNNVWRLAGKQYPPPLNQQPEKQFLTKPLFSQTQFLNCDGS